jgi:hypothetical protein
MQDLTYCLHALSESRILHRDAVVPWDKGGLGKPGYQVATG